MNDDLVQIDFEFTDIKARQDAKAFVDFLRRELQTAKKALADALAQGVADGKSAQQIKELQTEVGKADRTLKAFEKTVGLSEKQLAKQRKEMELAAKQSRTYEDNIKRLKGEIALLSKQELIDPKDQRRLVDLQKELQKTERDFGTFSRALATGSQESGKLLGSYNEIQRELKETRQAIRNLSEADRESDFGRNLIARGKELNNQLKKIDRQIGDSQRNVGNYPKLLSSLGGSFGKIAAIAGPVGLGLASVAAAFQGLAKVASQAFDAISEGAGLLKAQEEFDALSGSIDTTADSLLGKLRTATKGLATDADLISTANQIISLGLADTEDGVVRLANAASRLGLDMQQLTLTLANDSTARLDSLGLSVEGVTRRAGELEDTGLAKGDAFDLAVLEGLEDRIDLLGDASDTTAGKLQGITNEFVNIRDRSLAAFADGLAPFVDTISEELSQVDFSVISDEIGEVLSGLEASGVDLSEVVQDIVDIVEYTSDVIEFAQAVGSFRESAELVANPVAVVAKRVGEFIRSIKDLLETSSGVTDFAGRSLDVLNPLSISLDRLSKVISRQEESVESVGAAWQEAAPDAIELARANEQIADTADEATDATNDLSEASKEYKGSVSAAADAVADGNLTRERAINLLSAEIGDRNLAIALLDAESASTDGLTSSIEEEAAANAANLEELARLESARREALTTLLEEAGLTDEATAATLRKAEAEGINAAETAQLLEQTGLLTEGQLAQINSLLNATSAVEGLSASDANYAAQLPGQIALVAEAREEFLRLAAARAAAGALESVGLGGATSTRDVELGQAEAGKGAAVRQRQAAEATEALAEANVIATRSYSGSGGLNQAQKDSAEAAKLETQQIEALVKAERKLEDIERTRDRKVEDINRSRDTKIAEERAKAAEAERKLLDEREETEGEIALIRSGNAEQIAEIETEISAERKDLETEIAGIRTQAAEDVAAVEAEIEQARKDALAENNQLANEALLDRLDQVREEGFDLEEALNQQADEFIKKAVAAGLTPEQAKELALQQGYNAGEVAAATALIQFEAAQEAIAQALADGDLTVDQAAAAQEAAKAAALAGTDVQEALDEYGVQILTAAEYAEQQAAELEARKAEIIQAALDAEEAARLESQERIRDIEDAALELRRESIDELNTQILEGQQQLETDIQALRDEAVRQTEAANLAMKRSTEDLAIGLRRSFEDSGAAVDDLAGKVRNLGDRIGGIPRVINIVTRYTTEGSPPSPSGGSNSTQPGGGANSATPANRGGNFRPGDVVLVGDDKQGKPTQFSEIISFNTPGTVIGNEQIAAALRIFENNPDIADRYKGLPGVSDLPPTRPGIVFPPSTISNQVSNVSSDNRMTNSNNVGVGTKNITIIDNSGAIAREVADMEFKRRRNRRMKRRGRGE